MVLRMEGNFRVLEGRVTAILLSKCMRRLEICYRSRASMQHVSAGGIAIRTYTYDFIRGIISRSKVN